MAAPPEDLEVAQTPSWVKAIQSPAVIGPHSATLSRTARVTSPVRT
jgi:hypothetical protein